MLQNKYELLDTAAYDKIDALEGEYLAHEENINNLSTEYENINILEGEYDNINILEGEYLAYEKNINALSTELHEAPNAAIEHTGPELAPLPKDYNIVDLKNKIKKARAEHKAKQEELKVFQEDMSDELGSLIANKKLNKKFFFVTANDKVRLVDPKATPPLRTALDQSGADLYAERVYNTILGQNEEQMFTKSFEDIFGGEGASPLQGRTLLVKDTTLEPWLVNDMNLLNDVYSGYMSKKLGLEKAFQSMGTTSLEGQEELIKRLFDDFNVKNNELQAQPQSKVRDKAIRQLQKDKDQAEELINKGMRAYWGNYNGNKYSPKMKAFLGGLRNWTAAMGLGALPLMQMTDIGMIFREFGMGPTLQEGLFPLLKGIFTGANKATRADMAHAQLAMSSYLASYGDALYGLGTQYTQRGFMSRYAAMQSQKLGNLTGSNQLNDMLQHITGLLSQSKTYAVLEKHLKGEALSKVELERFNLLGLDKNAWSEKFQKTMAERIVGEFKTHGTFVKYKGGDKAQIANFAEWKDVEARQVFLNTIHQEVDSIILKPNIADVPFCFRDPVVQSMTMFMNYSFAATNHRLLNMLQRPTANKVMGEFIAMTIGAYVNPTRQYLSGQEPDLSTKALMASAVTNGAPGGIFIDAANRLNAMAQIPYLAKLKSSGDRYSGKGAAKLLLGAPGTAIDTLISTADIGFNILGGGAPSRDDVKRTLKTVAPWLWAMEFRRGFEAFLDSQNLDKRSRKAEGLLSE